MPTVQKYFTIEERKAAEKRWRDNWDRKNPGKRKESQRKIRIKRQHDPDMFITDLYQRVRNSATKRKKAMTITRADLETLVIESGGKCAISGLPLSTLHNDPNKASVDRINSKKGYIKGNIQLTTARANMMKKQWGDDDILEFCLAVVKHNGYKVNK